MLVVVTFLTTFTSEGASLLRPNLAIPLTVGQGLSFATSVACFGLLDPGEAVAFCNGGENYEVQGISEAEETYRESFVTNVRNSGQLASWLHGMLHTMLPPGSCHRPWPSLAGLQRSYLLLKTWVGPGLSAEEANCQKSLGIS